MGHGKVWKTSKLCHEHHQACERILDRQHETLLTWPSNHAVASAFSGLGRHCVELASRHLIDTNEICFVIQVDLVACTWLG